MTTICRTCLKLNNNESCSYMDLNAFISESDCIPIKDKLLACIPELSLNVVPDPSICNSCVKALQVTYQFWNQCLQTEDRIRNYMQKNSLSFVDLNNLEEFEQSDLRHIKESVVLSELMDLECRSPAEMHIEPDLINIEYIVPIPPSKEEIVELIVKEEIKEVDNNSLEQFDKYSNQNEEVIEVTIKSEEEPGHSLENSSESNSYVCYKCGQCCSTQGSLNYHMRSHSISKTKWNGVNNRKRSTLPLKRVNEHLSREMEKKKPHMCDVCGKRFLKSAALKSHQNVHNSEKQYRCDVCDKLFNFKNNLQRHLLLHIDGAQKQFKCNICEKLFKRKEHLHKHMISHTDGMPYQCTLCNKMFKYKDSLRGHLKYHSGEKRFRCDICGNGFIRHDNLVVHIKTMHADEKPLECDICKEEFVEKGAYEEHQKLHSKQTYYKCKTCNKLFKTKNNLRIHSNTHLNEKPYKCNICNNTFSQKGTLTYHIRTHTGEKPYTCFKCEKSFTQKATLRNHLKTHRSHSEVLLKEEHVREEIEVERNALENC